MKELEIIGNRRTCPAIALFNDGRLLIGLRNYTHNKWKSISVWTIPGGRSDNKETIEVTLRREVAEETGITQFQIKRYLGIVPGAKEGDLVHLFIGDTLQKARLMEPEKFSEWRWVPPKEVPKNFINKEALELIMNSIEL